MKDLTSVVGAELTLEATVQEHQTAKAMRSGGVEAHDDVEKIGEGAHERFIVNKERFEEKAKAKGGAK